MSEKREIVEQEVKSGVRCHKCEAKLDQTQAHKIEWIVEGKEMRVSHQLGGC